MEAGCQRCRRKDDAVVIPPSEAPACAIEAAQGDGGATSDVDFFERDRVTWFDEPNPSPVRRGERTARHLAECREGRQLEPIQCTNEELRAGATGCDRLEDDVPPVGRDGEIPTLLIHDQRARAGSRERKTSHLRDSRALRDPNAGT